MHNNGLIKTYGGVFFASFVILSGCASVGTKLAQDDRLTIVTEAPPEISIVVKKVNQDGESLEITGTLWWDREGPIGGDSGHIDVKVENADGEVVAESDAASHRIFVRRGVRRRASFSARVSSPAGERVTVHLVFHQGVRHDPTSDNSHLGPARANGGAHG